MAYLAFLTNLIGLDGTPESGGLINSYVRNTSTRSPLFSDVAGTPYTTNPVVAESLGQVAFYYRDDVQYEWRATTADGATTLWEADIVGGVFYLTYVNPDLVTRFEASATGTGAEQSVTIGGVVLTSAYDVFVTVDALFQPITAYTISSDGTDSFVALTAPLGAEIRVRSNAVQGLSIAADNLPVTPTGGTVGRSLADWMRDAFNVKAGWGGAAAVGDGTTDDLAAILRAVEACNAAGGGTVYFPKGTYSLTSDGVNALALEDLTGVRLVGAGKGITTLKLANNEGGMVVSFFDCVDVSVENMTVDGNRANQSTSGHCIRGENVDGLVIDNVEAKGAYSYGIGLQDGFFTRVRVKNTDIHDTGADGIDVKNKDDGTDSDGNEDLMMDNVSVWNWGNRADLTVQAAIDLRGTWLCSNIFIKEPARDDCQGFRLRFGEEGDGANGFGGHRSSLNGFSIDMGTKPSGLGISVGGRDASFSNGYIRGGQDGITIEATGERTRVTGVTIQDVEDDGIVTAAGADDCVFTAVHVIGGGSGSPNTDTGFNISSKRCRIIGGSADGCDEGFIAQSTCENLELVGHSILNSVTRTAQIVSGATDTIVRGGKFENNPASNAILDSGTGTRIIDVIGRKNQARGTASGTTDGSGDLTVTHGLAATPTTVRVTTGGTTFMQAQVHTKGASTFKIRFLDAAGAALTATAAAADWEAETALFG